MRLFLTIGLIALVVWFIVRAANKKRPIDLVKTESPSEVEPRKLISLGTNESHNEVQPRRGISLGGWLILFSSALAMTSLFMDWAEISFLLFRNISSKTGLAIGMIYVLALWFYPVSAAIKRQDMRISSTVLTSVLALTVPIVIALVIDKKGWGPFGVNPGSGVFVFWIAGVVLVAGMLLDKIAYLVKAAFGRNTN